MKRPQHPLTNLFDMEEQAEFTDDYSVAEVPRNDLVAPSEGPPVDQKDDDDILIEKRIDEVYEAAMQTFQNQTAFTEILEPRYAARNAEVAANYLNIALQAANSRAKAKVDRKRANQTFIPHGNGNKSTTNVIMASREDILKMITIDGESKEIK